MSTENEGRAAADRFRADRGLGEAPLPDLFTVVEEAYDVDVAIVAHGNDAHGLTVRHGNTAIVGIARTQHPMRQRSTLAHELGHLVFDDLTGAAPDRTWADRSPEEQRADAFARHLLVPLDGLRARVAERTPDEAVLSEMVQRFGASPQIVSYQLRRLQLITDERCEQWCALRTPDLATRFGWQAAYRAMKVESDTLRPPQRLLARATAAYAEGVVSVGMVARLNGSQDPEATRAELTAAGIAPNRPPLPLASRPVASTGGLSAADLDALLDDAD